MQNLPTAEIYEKENAYMPWGILMKEIQEIILREVPQNGAVLDLLCGPGYLLGKIQKERSDLHLTGVDLEPEFIEYAKKQYQGMELIIADAAEWKSEHQYEAVLCTGGLHHLPYEKQEPFLMHLSHFMKDEGFAIVADPYIDDYTDELSRRLAGAKLGYEYLVATMKNGASDDVIKATVGILLNDVLSVEYKNSLKKTKPLFEKYFSTVEMRKTWPSEESEYGDYYLLLKK